MKSSKALRVIIVNWNGYDQIVEAVQALRASELPEGVGLEVVVVDNGSTDDSLGWLKQANASNVLRLIELGCNRGFAYACNVGAKDFDGEFLLFLNPDTRIMPDAIDRAISVFENDSSGKIGVVGIQSIGEDGCVQRTCARFPLARNFINDAFGLSAVFPNAFPGLHGSIFDHDLSGVVDHVIGAFYLTRNSLFRQLSGFDERFFVYLEDLDFSWRVNQIGYASFYLAEARMYHKGGGISGKVKDRRLFYALRSRILYSFKHFSPIAAWGVAFATLFVEPVPRLLKALLHKSASEARNTSRAFTMLYRDLPHILSIR